MLAEAEDGIIAGIKGKPLAKRLRVVGSLPGLEEKSLVERWGTEAPATYVVMGNFPVRSSAATLRAGIVCVASNARGHDAARKGDGKLIGLYEIMDGVSAILDNGQFGGATWQVTDGQFMADEALFKHGLQVGIVLIETTGPISLPAALEESSLDDFVTFHADYDIAPHASGAEHQKWLQEPPDHSSSAPDITDHQNLRP